MRRPAWNPTRTEHDQKHLDKTLWNIADTLRGAMNADDFRDYMLSFLFLRYLSDNYEAATKKELGRDYPKVDSSENAYFLRGSSRGPGNGNGGRTPLSAWYADNPNHVATFEKLLKKCKKPDDVLFINAAEHFVKGKRQFRCHRLRQLSPFARESSDPVAERRAMLAAPIAFRCFAPVAAIMREASVWNRFMGVEFRRAGRHEPAQKLGFHEVLVPCQD